MLNILYVSGVGYVTPALPAHPETRSASGMFSPQTVTILKHLRKVDSISAVEAQAIYRCRSLTSRIAELRNSGFGIESVFSKDNTGQRYVRYFMRTDRPNVVTA